MAVFDDAIAATGGQAHLLTRKHRHELNQKWREVYAVGLHAATNSWIHLGYDWHVFSYNYARALAREEARTAYSQVPTSDRTIVCPREERLPAYEIIGGQPPNFCYQGQDILIWPIGFAWTMAFTHEDDWFGPYFSRREWVDPFAPNQSPLQTLR